MLDRIDKTLVALGGVAFSASLLLPSDMTTSGGALPLAIFLTVYVGTVTAGMSTVVPAACHGIQGSLKTGAASFFAGVILLTSIGAALEHILPSSAVVGIRPLALGLVTSSFGHFALAFGTFRRFYLQAFAEGAQGSLLARLNEQQRRDDQAA